MAQQASGTKAKLEQLAREYGAVALVTWFVMFGLVFAGFFLAISMGVDVAQASDVTTGASSEGASAAERASVAGAAYVATKLTTPLRIGATLVLTPFVARVARRMRRPKDGAPT